MRMGVAVICICKRQVALQPRSRAAAAAAAATDLVTPPSRQPPHQLSCCCRLGPVSLACKRFAAAARSPELLREADVVLPTLLAVRSFAVFLARHSQHLRQLMLYCQDGTEEGEVAAAAAVAACLAIAGAGAQLMELNVIGCIRSSDWLAAMPALRRLQLEAHPHDSRLHMSPAIGALAALIELELEGRLMIPAGTRLPASLERLTLRWDYSDALPEQASGCADLLSAFGRKLGYKAIQ